MYVMNVRIRCFRCRCRCTYARARQGLWYVRQYKVTGIMQKVCRNVPVGYMYHLEKECKECKCTGHMLNQTGGHTQELILMVHEDSAMERFSSYPVVLCFTCFIQDGSIIVHLMNYSFCHFSLVIRPIISNFILHALEWINNFLIKLLVIKSMNWNKRT